MKNFEDLEQKHLLSSIFVYINTQFDCHIPRKFIVIYLFIFILILKLFFFYHIERYLLIIILCFIYLFFIYFFLILKILLYFKGRISFILLGLHLSFRHTFIHFSINNFYSLQLGLYLHHIFLKVNTKMESLSIFRVALKSLPFYPLKF